MSNLNAFVGHSFIPTDHQVVEIFLKFFNQVQAMNIGFAWQSAEPAEPKVLADKVMALIEGKNLFIAICTKKEAAIEPARLRKAFFSRNLIKANEEHFSWKTSDWIIQEIGLALGRDMDVILLVEEGLRQPGGLQGNLEYISFQRSAPEKCFGKVLEMIRALMPKAKDLPAPLSETQMAPEEKPSADEEKSPDWLIPKENWTRSDYDLALFRMINAEDQTGEREITEAYLASKEGQNPANRESWEGSQEYLRLVLVKGGKLGRLEEMAKKYPENSEIQRYLAMAYRRYEDHKQA